MAPLAAHIGITNEAVRNKLTIASTVSIGMVEKIFNPITHAPSFWRMKAIRPTCRQRAVSASGEYGSARDNEK